MSPDREILTIGEDYEVGDLSLFPEKLDDSTGLYQTSNNAIAALVARLPNSTTSFTVNSAEFFPDHGIVRVNDEQIYYGEKSGNVFSDLIRGFNGSPVQNHGAGSLVLGCVSSLHHNSVRDAHMKAQQKTGLISDPPDIDGTLTSRVKFLDNKWFTPTARFFGFPLQGRAPLTVNFRTWSLGDPYISFIWDFGDLNNPEISTERNPVHIYEKPGLYTVNLTVRGTDGKNSLLSKNEYVRVFDDDTVFDPIAYARDPDSLEKLRIGETGTPLYDSRIPLTVEFVDQTLGLVQARRWNFGDGTIVDVNTNPYDHIITHTYTQSGIYWPELQALDQNETLRVYKFRQPVVAGLGLRVEKVELVTGQPLNDSGQLLRPTLGLNARNRIKLNKINDSLIIG